MIRAACGTVRGVLEHQAAREWPCGWCVHAERVARLSAERLASLPEDRLLPVTPEQALANAWLLDRETAAFDREHRNGSRNRWLRSVA
jgi:hypothetical protein